MPWVRHDSTARWRRACDSARPFYQSWARGASIFKMMEQSRHRSVETLRGYVRDAEIFKEHAGAGLL
jgi:hypothetical protein